MTNQIRNLCAQRVGDTWQVLRAPLHSYLMGNDWVNIINAQGEPLSHFCVMSLFPGGKRYISFATNGLNWCQKLVAYITNLNGEPYFVGRTWWGDRFLIALDRSVAESPEEFQTQLDSAERNIVLKYLKETLRRVPFDENGPPRDLLEGVSCSLSGAAHLAGCLKVKLAIPWLQALEEFVDESRQMPTNFEWEYRRLANRGSIQMALRRLGQVPRFPVIDFGGKPPLNISPVEYAARRKQAADVKPGMKLKKVYERCGPPDFIEGPQWRAEIASDSFRSFAWRYDIDDSPPFTTMLWFDQDPETITRVKHYYPAFWEGVHLFPSDEEFVDDEGSVSERLEDHQFLGKCIRVYG